MASGNNNVSPDQPPQEPGESAPTRDWKLRLNQYVWALRAHVSNQTSVVQNHGNSITNLQTVVQQINAQGGGGKIPVIYGPHSLRVSDQYVPGLFGGFIFVETDRFQAAYYSNNNAWVLIGAAGTGSFEGRYTGLNSQDAGFEWIETSRNNIAGIPPYPLYRWGGNNWSFISGEFYRNQNQLSTLANTFAANNSNNGNDIGARVNVLDFAGQLQWTAPNNWTWGPDDCLMHGSGPIAWEITPSPLAGWQEYDGSNNVSYLKSDGTIGNVNLPNLVSANNVAFLEFGNITSNNNVIPAVTPVFMGNAASGSVSGTFSGFSNNFTTNNFSTGGNNTAVALTGPNPIAVGGSISGTLTGNAVSGTISNNGQPPSVVRRAWFRR